MNNYNYQQYEETLGDMYTAWYNVHKDELDGDDNGNLNSKIERGALDFLTYYCGKLPQEITNDSNMNVLILQNFASTFVKHFWLNYLGFSDAGDLQEDVFGLRLSAFLNEELPVWEKEYNEMYVKSKLFVTQEQETNGTENENQTQNDKITGVTDTTGNTQGNSSNTTDSTTTDTKETNGTTSETKTGTSKEDSTNNSKTNTNGTENTTNNNSGTGLTIDSQQPQDRINVNNVNKNETDSALKPEDVYGFDYANDVNGSWSTGKESVNKQNTGESSVTSTGSNTGNTSEDTKGTSVLTENGKSNTHSESRGTTGSNTTGHSENSNTKNSVGMISRGNSQIVAGRSLPLIEIVKMLDTMANGLYNNLFKKAKEAGLFDLVY